MNNREIIEFAAKAVGNTHDSFDPITNPADTAEMCAKLDIGVTYQSALGFLVCRKSIDVASVAHYKDHDNSRLKAWMYAATMVAAKIGGYEDEF